MLHSPLIHDRHPISRCPCQVSHDCFTFFNRVVFFRFLPHTNYVRYDFPRRQGRHAAASNGCAANLCLLLRFRTDTSLRARRHYSSMPFEVRGFHSSCFFLAADCLANRRAHRARATDSGAPVHRRNSRCAPYRKHAHVEYTILS